jgi:histidine triad (HIT) family protein
MAIDSEQAKSIKEQLLKQLDSFPEDKREEIKEYVNSMNTEQLEEFLIQNNLIKTEDNTSKNSPKQGNECVYCLLSSKQIASLPIYEDKDYLGVLEIRPVSQGHVILIPKEHVKETKNLKSKALSIADKIGKHLVKKLEAENFQISTSDEMKHAIVNIIPKYKGKEPDYKRTPADTKKLQELALKIGQIKKSEKKQVEKKKSDKKPKEETEKTSSPKKSLPSFSRRIP